MSSLANILAYKGYLTKIEYSVEDQVLHGQIESIVDLVTFESDSINEIEKEFHEAVDDYLLFCTEIGKEPNKAYKGSFNVRVEPQLHKEIALIAYKNGDSLNETIEQALKIYVNQEPSILGELCSKLSVISDSISSQVSTMWDQSKLNGCNIEFIEPYMHNQCEMKADHGGLLC